MATRKLTHHFCIGGSFPRFIFSQDNLGNRYREIELVEDLCTTRGRLCTDDFQFREIPDFASMDARSEEFRDTYFSMMGKLAMCFDYIQISTLDRLLGWGHITYYRSGDDRIVYPDMQGFMDMKYGPMIMYLNHVRRYRMKITHRKYGPIRALSRYMVDLLDKVKSNYGYHIMTINQYTNSPETCSPIADRAVMEMDHVRDHHIGLNGFTLVLEDDVPEIDPDGLDKYSHQIRHVRGIGSGVALLDIVAPIRDPIPGRRFNSIYNPPTYSGGRRSNRPIYSQPQWGPLYPSIIFSDETEKRMLDSSHLLQRD